MSQMTKEKFLKRQDEIQNEILALQIELEQAKQKYIQDNCSYAIGDRVKVIIPGKPTNMGLVVRIDIYDDGKFIGILQRINKDGKLSEKFLYYEYWNATLEKIDSPLEA